MKWPVAAIKICTGTKRSKTKHGNKGRWCASDKGGQCVDKVGKGSDSGALYLWRKRAGRVSRGSKSIGLCTKVSYSRDGDSKMMIGL